MARKYTRDNRGRFASSGGGATARGGRLKTAGGNKRATQTMRAQGAGGAGVMKGRAARTVAGESVMRKLPKAAPKAVTPKAAPNAAKQRYKQASSTARAVGRDLRGASPMERRTANSKAAVVRNMERNRSTATASAANSPKAAQKARETARAKRAQSQFSAGMARESEGPGSKASRKVTVARRAMQIYSGKVDPKAKATARLTRTTDQYKLQDRIRRSAKLKPPKSPKPAAPAQAKAAPKAATATKPTLKRTGETIKKPRARPPATTLQYKQAVPVTNANRPRRDRASAVMQRSVSGTVGFPEMQKLRIKAGVAANPYSDMSKGQRTKAANNLANAELQNKKASKSYGIGAKAYDTYTNLAGHTQGEGRKKWRRAGQRATSLGAGTIRGGARRSDKPVSAPAGNTQRQSRSRLWYETKGKRK